MKRLFWMLPCIALVMVQISGAAFAVNPRIGSGYVSITNIDGSEPVKAQIQIPDNDNTLKINTTQPLITFGGAGLLETNKAITNPTDSASARAGFVTQSNYFNLDSGNILVSPDKDIVIGTQEGTVSISSGATIFVMESGMDTVIYDLYQARPQQVSVTINKHKLVMSPGCMLVLSKEKIKNFEELHVNCHTVSYRKAQEIDIQEDSINAFVANFSIFSALVKIQPLKQLVDSKDKRDQQLLNKLLKSAAMLRT